MSSVYQSEPPTQGKVVLRTTFGDVDIELWPREAPLACRNFVQLVMEGYYDNTIFHRIIKGFMIQGGDPTGTGEGGESIYGRAFKDELHGRLRFTHRGLVAMANENKSNSNHSQFFFTLDACEWLRGKHTIFGKITGNTIFNVLRMGDVEVDENDRPLEPPRILSGEVLANPFDDIAPRVKEPPRPTAEEEEARAPKRKGKKDLKLLSFGEEAEEDEQVATSVRGGMHSVHDSRLADKKLSKQTAIPPEELEAMRAAARQGGAAHEDTSGDEFAAQTRGKLLEQRRKLQQSGALRSSVPPALPTAAAAAAAASKAGKDSGDESEPESESDYEGNTRNTKVGGHTKAEKEKIKELSAEFRRLREEARRSKRAVGVLTGEEAAKQRADEAYHEMLTPLQAKRRRFMKQKQVHGDREKETLERLNAFTSKLKKSKRSHPEPESEPQADPRDETYHGQVLEGNSDDEAGNDKEWFKGKLKFKKHIDDAFRAGDDGRTSDDYQTIDTRRR